MLKHRIVDTLRFFALQNIPLTLFELHKYLLPEREVMEEFLNQQWEVKEERFDEQARVSVGEVLNCLEQECQSEVAVLRGYYYLNQNPSDLVTTRLSNYIYAIYREQLISKYKRGLGLIPFLRGMGLVGSQALGLPKRDSDIDLFIIVKRDFLWLARFFVTLYFQLTGHRRHGKHIANRFCLNHYLAGTSRLHQDRNIYTASEYLKMRPIYGARVVNEFKIANLPWVALFFPNSQIEAEIDQGPSWIQQASEKILTNRFGRWLEQVCRSFQLRRINRSEFVVVEENELSFHPDNRKAQLFSAFFKDRKDNHREAM